MRCLLWGVHGIIEIIVDAIGIIIVTIIVIVITIVIIDAIMILVQRKKEDAIAKVFEMAATTLHAVRIITIIAIDS